MAKVNTWMPFYVSDYLKDTDDLSLAEHGAYCVLLFKSWESGPIANDEIRIARLLRCDVKEWRKVAPAVLAHFTVIDGKLIQKRLEAERTKAQELSEKRRDAALKKVKTVDSGNTDDPGKRSNSDSKPDSKPVANVEHMLSNSSAIADANAAANDEELVVHARVARQSQSPRKKDPPSLRDVPPDGKRGSRLPRDWCPNEADCQFASALGLEPDRIADRFRDFWHAKPGAAGRKLDWPATWRNWCRRDAEHRRTIDDEGPLTAMVRAEREAKMRQPPQTPMVLQ
jgi:uncharacterized protein YdaU (DUF1376 family)